MSLPASPTDSLPVYSLGVDSRGSKEALSSLLPIISLACWCNFPGPFFLEVSTVTWAGRKFARVSDNCAKGSRKQADGKRVSTGRLLPTRLSGLRYEHVRGDLGAPGRRGKVWGQGSSLMQERKSMALTQGQENTAG